MAQLRHDYQKFIDLNCEVLVMVPNGPHSIAKYRAGTGTMYPILTDKGSKVAEQFFQVKKFFIAGTPTVLLIEKGGRIAYAHYAKSLLEEPDNGEPLAVLKKLKG